MKTLFYAIIVLLAWMLPGWAIADSCMVDDSFWLQPRSGLAVLNYGPIKPCVSALLADPHSHLLISYNDNDDSSVAAGELRQWLLALGLPGPRILLKKQPVTNAEVRLDTEHDQ